MIKEIFSYFILLLLIDIYLLMRCIRFDTLKDTYKLLGVKSILTSGVIFTMININLDKLEFFVFNLAYIFAATVAFFTQFSIQIFNF